MNKIPKGLLLRLDILFYSTLALLIVTWMTGMVVILGLTVVSLGLYVWAFLSIKCPHCRRNIMPWTAGKSKYEATSCPHCGFPIEIG